MTNPMELFTPFLSTTYNIPEEEDRVNTYLVDRFSSFADVINDKKIGVYAQGAQNLNGEKWFYRTTKKTRNGYQTIAYIPFFPDTGVLTLTLDTIPVFPITGINTDFVITMVYGSASKPCTAISAGDGDYFSFFSEGNSKITFTMSDTQIVITTTTDMTAYNGSIVIHYLRDGV